MNPDNIRTDADFVNMATLGALGGAVGGAAGFAASSAVAGVLGTTGAIPGFVTSASGGFAGGFAGTSVTSWCTGSTFGDGLWAGLKAGAISGLAAGLIGAHNGAIDAINAGGEMWTGAGAVFDCMAPEMPLTNASDPIDYSNESATKFSDEYFGDIQGLRNRYADGTIPPPNDKIKYVKDGNKVFRYEYNKTNKVFEKKYPVLGTARFIRWGKTDVYLYEAAFSSKEQLYLTMQHEYLHVAFNSDRALGSPYSNWKFQEAACYSMNVDQAKLWGMDTSFYDSMYGIYKSYYRPSLYNPNKYGYYLFIKRAAMVMKRLTLILLCTLFTSVFLISCSVKERLLLNYDLNYVNAKDDSVFFPEDNLPKGKSLMINMEQLYGNSFSWIDQLNLDEPLIGPAFDSICSYWCKEQWLRYYQDTNVLFYNQRDYSNEYESFLLSFRNSYVLYYLGRIHLSDNYNSHLVLSCKKYPQSVNKDIAFPKEKSIILVNVKDSLFQSMTEIVFYFSDGPDYRYITDLKKDTVRQMLLLSASDEIPWWRLERWCFDRPLKGALFRFNEYGKVEILSKHKQK